MSKFTIEQNQFLRTKSVRGYYNQVYVGYNQPGNPDFINDLKNTFGTTNSFVLSRARNTVESILLRDIPAIMRDNNLSSCVCVCVPRAKSPDRYSRNQLYFKEAVSNAARRLRGVVDGTDVIQRRVSTYTTHLDKATREGRIRYNNDGDKPYRGITRDTCYINRSMIQGKTVILVDDIYTRTVNVDEDCIQALFDNGAKDVIFYSVGYTQRRF